MWSSGARIEFEISSSRKQEIWGVKVYYREEIGDESTNACKLI